MLIQPADPFGMSIGTVYGEMRCQPLSLSASYAVRVDPMPPIPLVTLTPSRSGSTPGEPASAHASRAATSASCSQRSIRRACTRPTTSTGSTAACAAMRTGRSSAHGSAMRRTPLRPASIADQVDATSPPSGVVAPSPVTTTLTRSLLLTEVLLPRGGRAPPTPLCLPRGAVFPRGGRAPPTPPNGGVPPPYPPRRGQAPG